MNCIQKCLTILLIIAASPQVKADLFGPLAKVSKGIDNHKITAKKFSADVNKVVADQKKASAAKIAKLNADAGKAEEEIKAVESEDKSYKDALAEIESDPIIPAPEPMEEEEAEEEAAEEDEGFGDSDVAEDADKDSGFGDSDAEEDEGFGDSDVAEDADEDSGFGDSDVAEDADEDSGFGDSDVAEDADENSGFGDSDAGEDEGFGDSDEGEDDSGSDDDSGDGW